ncbi:MotB family protein [Hyphomicrobium sp.]|uniref:MotB family protein n=1 Tax=Hyphomicrobium sp. TaxID=82 RepID=UPI0025BA755E|nr:MotB family protein [Hyphomicrobium sp.]MCC7251466.1 MotB family protein [Hyphomicrobium sp.]
MSADGDMPVPHEVVIVRRRGGDGDDGHHGGAWKIAFADLMTAMMAFFLVMWLLNVSDKEKIQQIATYFNPLKLNSKRPTVKGMEDERDPPKSAPATEGPADRGAHENTVDDKNKRQAASKPGGDGDLPEGDAHMAEEELFNDPYGVLARLAMKAEGNADQSNVSRNDSLGPAGEAFSNPFEPFADQSLSQPKAAQSEHEQMTLTEPGAHPLPPGLDKPLEVKPDVAEDGPPDATDQKASSRDAPSDRISEQVRTLEGELAKALGMVADDKKPNIEVKRVDEGVMISLTDDFRFGMFDSASATPKPEMVVVMEKVANVLAAHQGRIIVRGHTDARPFRTERNNNWRLSMARAQAAYYMLARGGIEERRFESIEGRADRNPKNITDPNAAENRRIEIMLRPSL